MGSFVGRGNQYIQLGFEPPTSEVGGECVTTVSPWPPFPYTNIKIFVNILCC